ncbi:MAG: DNA-deoxyinosine glycosylase [Mucinivorans sp.]
MVPSDIKHSFLPLDDPQAEILILGSMPSDRSISLQQYYGHPQNRFWRVMAWLAASDLPAAYPDRCAMLRVHHIALWDVVCSARRVGSLDSAISDERVNDIAAFVAWHPFLRVIVFNGRKAEQLYDRYFDRFCGLRYCSLPSTSAANAGQGLVILCERWSVIL